MKPLHRLFCGSLLLLSVQAFLGAVSTAQCTIRVPGDHATIAAALAAAGPGCKILVARGTYSGNLLWPNVDGIVLESEEGAAVTTITGGSPVIAMLQGGRITDATVVRGFTITGGRGDWGTGVWIAADSPTLEHNIIEGNKADGPRGGYGAGVLYTTGAPVIRSNLFRDNDANNNGTIGGVGGGIYGSGPAVILANTFVGNRAGVAGGGVNVTDGAIVQSNVFVSNSAGYGGGLYSSGAVAVVNNTFAQNFASTEGGGLRHGTVDPATRIANNIFAGNGGFRFGALSMSTTLAPSQLDSNLYHDNGPQELPPFQAYGPNSVLQTDPLFVGPGDYHINARSAARDRGDEAKWVGGRTVWHIDADGQGRQYGLAIDIGADEYSISSGISVVGQPRRNSTVTFSVADPPGAVFLLYWSVTPGHAVIRSFGTVLIASPFYPLGGGFAPGSQPVTIPNLGALVGTTVYVQGVVATGSVTEITQRVTLTVF